MMAPPSTLAVGDRSVPHPPPRGGSRRRRSSGCPTRCASCSRACCARATRTACARSRRGSRTPSRRTRSRSRPARDPAAGLHRRAGRRRPRRDARRDGRARRRSRADQPVDPGRARDRPLGAGRRVRDRACAFARNVELELERNRERYAFLRWGQRAFADFKVVPPGTGICHQVNLEYLARVVEDRDGVAFPDTVVGTDSHTTMVNGLGVLGWGVGGIEAEAAMLGEPLSMLVPQVVGFRLVRPVARRRDRDRPRAHRDRAAAQDGRRRQVRRVLRRGARRAARSPTARRSGTCRPSTARRAASSRSTS